MIIDLSKMNAEQPVTFETLEEDGVFAFLVAADDDGRVPVIEFENLNDTQCALAWEFARAFFLNVDILD